MMSIYYRLICIALGIFFVTQGRGQTMQVYDTNFRNCLKDRYASLLNNKGELVLSAVSNFKGRLACISYNIKSIEGIQYFTGATDLEFNRNNLSTIPDLSALSRLIELDVSYNNLTYLPDLSKFRHLKDLAASNNNIVILPDLSHNDSLLRLRIHYNKLDTLPDLGHLKQLTYLNTTGNNLRSIPGLGELVSLKYLLCWNTKITVIPSLDKLSKLTTLHASQNGMTVLPVKLPLRTDTLLLDKNLLTRLPDLSANSNLKFVKLQLNKLTFKELLRLTSVKNYTSVFQVNPQLPLPVGKKFVYKEKEKVILSTGVDDDVTAVIYEWYKNGKQIKSTFSDSLLFLNISSEDSGKYTCLLKHPAFPNFSLTTDTFFVSVSPCMDTSNVTIRTTDINCLKDGTITVEGNVNSSSLISYEIIAKDTRNVYTSGTGFFKNLPEPAYTLSFKTAGNCEIRYPGEIKINNQSCEEVVISPNGDGEKDTYFFTDSGNVSIFDKKGNLIKNMTIPGEWDGKSNKGQLSTGFYLADINNGQEVISITVIY